MTNLTLMFKFGTFEDRLAHYCALFEIDRPDVVYEHGSPVLTDELHDWIIEHHVSFDWLFVGDPRSLLCEAVNNQKQARRCQDAIDQLEPEVQKAMTAMIKAVVENDLPMAPALEVFEDVVKDWRTSKAA